MKGFWGRVSTASLSVAVRGRKWRIAFIGILAKGRAGGDQELGFRVQGFGFRF